MSLIQRMRMTSQERQKQILRKSLEIIYEKGFSSLTVQHIADRIGISQAAIYRHYENKHEIVKNLAELAFLPPLITTKQIKECDPTHLLHLLICRQVQELENNPCLTAIVFQEEMFHEYPDIKEEFIECQNRLEDVITAIVRHGQAEGVFSKSVNPQIFALIYMGSIRKNVLDWRSSGFAYSLTEQSRKIVEELFKLLKGSRCSE